MKKNNKLIIIGLCVGIVITLISLFLFVSKKANKTENDYIYIKNNLSIKKKETLDKDGKQLEKLIPNAGLVIYDGCTHYAYLERLNQTINVLRSFIESEE